MSCRVAILISGNGSNMAALVDAMADPEFGAVPVLVASDNPHAPGLARTERSGVETAVVDRARFGSDRTAFERALDGAIRARGADMICLAGFMRILSPEFVSGWTDRILNIHPSLLPMHPGLDTHRRAIAAGDEFAGCSVHVVTAELDGGPVLGQTRVRIRRDDTVECLSARVLEAEHRLYPSVLRDFARRRQRPAAMTPVTAIRNLGPASARDYGNAGITSAEQVRALGPDEAYLRVMRAGAKPHFIGFCAVVLGLEGRDWTDCSEDERTALRKRFEGLKARIRTGPVPELETELDAFGVVRAGPSSA